MIVESSLVRPAPEAGAPADAPPSVAVLGMGYVGLPTALALHAAGARVLGIDSSPERLAEIRAAEPDLIAADRLRLTAALADPHFELTGDPARLAEADAAMVCVPTPVDPYLTPDLRALSAACATLARHARAGQTLLLTSTSFVGTTAKLLVEPLVARGLTVGRDVFVASSPERIDPGNTTHTQRETPRVLGGVTPRCAEMARRIIGLITPSVHVVSSPEAAEMTKLYENSFRAVNIALANEFAEVCAELSLDPMEVTRAAATKPYGYMPFYPGPGVGGHCIPCDPHYLIWQLRASGGGAPLVSQAMTAIAARPRQVADRAVAALARSGRGIGGALVVVVGVSYKPGVRDVRSSSALEIIARLTALGAKVDYYDPLVPHVATPEGARLDSAVRPEGEAWDLALVHTVHPGHDYSWVGDCPIVVDATYRFAGAQPS